MTSVKKCQKPIVLNPDSTGIRIAAKIVSDGGILAFPTDTVYGMGCDPFNNTAVYRVLRAKGRQDKPMPILVSSPTIARRIAFIDEVSSRLIRKFWPGPLTIILKARRAFPPGLTSGGGMIGLRCPDSRLTRALIKACGGLLVGTSANLTGHPPSRSASEVIKQLDCRIDAVIDGGRSPRKRGSTVLQVCNGRLVILRKGPVAIRSLLDTV
jgi:L-threonylcarbamoyladenylate synthase